MAQIETKKTIPAKIAVAKKAAVVKKTAPIQTPEVVMPVSKTARYLNKNLKVSPRKLRIIANIIKKFTPADAVIRLKFTNTNAARLLGKCVEMPSLRPPITPIYFLKPLNLPMSGLTKV